MANYLVTDTELTSIADAIRTKGGTSASLEFPTDFVSAIENIPSGGGGGSTTVSVSEFTGNIYYIDPADGMLKYVNTGIWTGSVPSGSMVVLLWNGPKPPIEIQLTNLTLVYSVSNGSRASYPYVDFCIAD